jgi:hypothetical protein
MTQTTENVYTQNTMNADGISLYVWVHSLNKPISIFQKSEDGALCPQWFNITI